PFQQLHGHERDIVFAIEVVHTDNVGMGQTLGLFGFLLQYGQCMLMAGKRFTDDFQRHPGGLVARLSLPQIASLVYGAHATGADELNNFKTLLENLAKGNSGAARRFASRALNTDSRVRGRLRLFLQDGVINDVVHASCTAMTLTVTLSRPSPASVRWISVSAF